MIFKNSECTRNRLSTGLPADSLREPDPLATLDRKGTQTERKVGTERETEVREERERDRSLYWHFFISTSSPFYSSIVEISRRLKTNMPTLWSVEADNRHIGKKATTQRD